MSVEGSHLTEAIRVAVSALRHIADPLESALSPASAQHGSARAPVSVLLSLLRGTWSLKVSRSQRHLRTRTFSKWLSCLLRCLPIALKLCNRLGQNKEERAQRAWEAGTWARAVLEGRISKPWPTEKLAIQPAGYIVWCACGTRKVWCVLSV